MKKIARKYTRTDITFKGIFTYRYGMRVFIVILIYILICPISVYAEESTIWDYKRDDFIEKNLLGEDSFLHKKDKSRLIKNSKKS